MYRLCNNLLSYQYLPCPPIRTAAQSLGRNFYSKIMSVRSVHHKRATKKPPLKINKCFPLSNHYGLKTHNNYGQRKIYLLFIFMHAF